MQQRLMRLALGLAVVAGLSACNESPQTITTKTSDVPAWDGTQNGFSVGGWKAGDEASWQSHLNKRANGQNEYNRMGGA